jgi:hypothetical protein
LDDLGGTVADIIEMTGGVQNDKNMKIQADLPRKLLQRRSKLAQPGIQFHCYTCHRQFNSNRGLAIHNSRIHQHQIPPASSPHLSDSLY